MLVRVQQVARHLSRSLPEAATRLASPRPSITSRAMASTTAQKSLINTAACLIIGDEVLGGKTVDTNSAYFAKFCFSLGINLRRIEVIADDEGEIVEAVRRMSNTYDFVVTSGGIGPTHDDITYQSIAKAFHLQLKLHDAAYERMKRLSKPHKSQPNFSWDTPSSALTAKKRMVELPLDESVSDQDQVIFVADDLWVPVSCVNANIHILPGVPRLFEQMLAGLKPRIQTRLEDAEGNGAVRIFIRTPMAESGMAGYLGELAARTEPKGVKVGSYPRWGKDYNTVTLVGRDVEFMESLVPEVCSAIEGQRVQVESESEAEKSDKES